MPASARVARIAHETDTIDRVVRRLCEDCGERRAGTPGERRAQAVAEQEFAALGVHGAWESFTFSDNLYAVMAAHFGLGLVGHAIAGALPRTGAAVRAFGALSYYLDATRQAYLLRSALPMCESQNWLATLPARSGQVRRRFVFLAHADTALTGTIFHPRVVRATQGGADHERGSYLQRSLELATDAELLAAAVAVVRAASSPRTARRLRWLEHALSIPGLLTAVANAEVVARDQSVPGAADNATGVAASILLASRLAERQPDDVEYVFAVTGCEEAGTGGAWQLCRSRHDRWSRERTTVVAIDTLSNGELRWFREGEMGPIPVPTRVRRALEQLRSDGGFPELRQHAIPAGATDAMPFLAAGYEAIGIGCVDPELGAPRHYHRPSDVPEHVDLQQVVRAVDLVEAMIRLLEKDRMGPPEP